jgi:TPP-dependent trihydroxycyclohexane-1,2-dione (THcHDO) dehydratase
MENMASRPFTRLLVDVTKNENTMSAINDFKETNQLESSKLKGFNVEFKYMKNSKKSSKKYNNDSLNKPVVSSSSNSTAAAIANKLRIMPVAVEPMSNNKSAILTCLLKLPQGDLNYVPKGSSPFVLASAYVQLSSSSPFLNFNNNNDSNLVDDDEQSKNQKNEKQF